MKNGIHPEYKLITVTCSCGNTFQTVDSRVVPADQVCRTAIRSARAQKIVDSGGRVDRFRKKYARG
jgi:large subunit ribosomal protein L31